MVSVYFCSLCWVPPYSNEFLIFRLGFLLYIFSEKYLCLHCTISDSLRLKMHHFYFELIILHHFNKNRKKLSNNVCHTHRTLISDIAATLKRIFMYSAHCTFCRYLKLNSSNLLGIYIITNWTYHIEFKKPHYLHYKIEYFGTKN